MNKLYFGDNLEILREVEDERVHQNVNGAVKKPHLPRLKKFYHFRRRGMPKWHSYR